MKRTIFLIVTCLLAAGPLRGAESYLAAPDLSGSRFLLLDRSDPARIFGVEESTSGGEEFLPGGDLPLSGAPAEKWDKVRRDIEEGRFSRAELAPRAEIEVSTGVPLPPQPEVEFTESGSKLSVTGRKLITLNYTGKRYLNEQKTVTRPRSLSLFEINQQMQVRMQGQVGNKITVNVDYDDTKQDKQDISVVYRGDPDEVVQNVSFGDIDLSLPATEFVSYNKQLFGIRADLKSRSFKFTFVGSRTKGTTKTKQFLGNTQYQAADILDTNYLRRKYYDVTFGNPNRLPIKAGSERIYIDQQNQTIADGVTVFSMTANDLAVQTSTYTGHFQIMNPGIDYVMDYVKGIVTFGRNLNPQDVVIIDFDNGGLGAGTRLSDNTSSTTFATGGSGYKLIKTPNDIQIASAAEAGWNRELKTYYSIGQTNLVRDDGRGNFSLKVQDLNRNNVGTSLNPRQVYPETIEVDFEQGIFRLLTPFASENDPAVQDAQIYSAAPVSRRVIRVEYSFRFKTFTLEPSIVPQSEVVQVDGRRLARNEKYYLDYDSGFITFYYPEEIGQNSKIDITYEVSPFGGIGNQSLVGGRISYDLGRHMSFGSTLLYQGGIKSNTVPNVTDLANSMLVYEGDAQLKGLNLLGLRANLAAEAAQSRLNPNLNDYALLDNMEGVKQDDNPSLDANFWRIASNPSSGPSDPPDLSWYSENVKAVDINPASTSEGTQQVLGFAYDFRRSTEVSIVYPLSATGLDFSQKTALELVVYGDSAQGPQFNIHLGQINEDADGAGGMNFACSNGLNLSFAPKSEDVNCDGQVAPAEDVGWLYAPAGLTAKRYGAENGRLDSQDLNQNGRLDPADLTGGGFGYVNGTKFTDNNDSTQKNRVDFTGWHTLYYPVSIASTETYKWNAVKQVRISLKQAPGGASSGVVKFARISAVGNTWAVSQSTTTGAMKVLAENNVDNPGYAPIYDAGGEATSVFNDLYGSVSEQKDKTNSRNLVEQSLSIRYSGITSTSTAYVYRKFTVPVDVSQHAKFRFLLKPDVSADPNAAGARFFLRIGDDNNYFRAEVPLDFSGWRLYTIAQEDLTGDKIPDVWANGSNYTMHISSKGKPSLQQVAQLTMGIAPSDANSHDGAVYVNELHLAKPIGRTGNARKVEGSFEIPGFISFGGKHRYVDRNFQTPVTVIANQDSESQSGYLNVNFLHYRPWDFSIPLGFTAARQITTTPNAMVTGSNNLVNSLQQGKVKRFDGSASSGLNIRHMPKLGVSYGKSRTNYLVMARQDDTDTYSANLSYTMPLNLRVLPLTYSLNASQSRNKVGYEEEKLLNLAGLYDTEERSETYSAKLTYAPWRGAAFNPGYSLQQVREKRLPLANPAAAERYPKSRQQTVDFNSNWMVFSWLNPSVNYSISTIENNNLNVTTVTVVTSSTVYRPGEIKTVNRNAQGTVSLTLNMNDLLPGSRLLRSLVLSSNYNIQDGDSWANVERSYDTRRKLWLRDSLSPLNPFASRNSVTLRDTVSSSQRWQPFEGFELRGRTAPLKTVSLTNNFTNSVQRSEVTGTRSESVSRTFPDMILSMSQLETLTRTAKWAQNASVNLKYSANTNEAKTISLDTARSYGMDLRFRLLNYADTAMSYNRRLAEKEDLRIRQRVSRSVHQDATLQGTFSYRKFNFTPKADYVNDKARGALGVVTQNTTVVTPSLLVKTDIQIPRGLKLPFMKAPIMFTNRIVWTTTMSYAFRKSPVTVAENTRLLSVNSSADYEAAKNLRLTFNGGIQRLWNKYLKQDDYFSYQFGSTLTFQF